MKAEWKQDKMAVFLIISGAGILLTLLYWIISGNGTAVFDWLVLGESNDWELADFFRHIGYSANLKETYWVSRDACFPPLAYLFFHLLYRMNLAAFFGLEAEDWQSFAATPYAILLYLVFVVILTLCFVTLVRQATNLPEGRSLIFCVVLLLSFPFFTALERGNPVLLTVLLLLAALCWMEAEEKWKREAALLLIAIAVCFKLYPAILVLLYWKRRRFAEGGRLILYSVVLFFLPFLFTGGIAGFLQYMDVLLHGHYNAGFMREWSSVRGVSYVIGARLGFTDEGCVRMGQVLENLFLLLSVGGLFVSNKRWKEIFFLSVVMCFYMPTSWVYNTVYLALPLLFFVAEKENKKEDLLYAALFGLIFTIPIWCLTQSAGTWVCLVAYLLWLILLLRSFLLVVFSVRRD